MGLANQVATISLILLFALDVFTDVATGVELILNDKPFCESFIMMIRKWIHGQKDHGDKFMDENASAKFRSNLKFSDKNGRAFTLKMLAWLEAAGNGSMHLSELLRTKET